MSGRDLKTRRRYGLRAFLAVLLLGLLAGLVLLVHPVWAGEQGVRLTLWLHGVKSESVVVDGNRIHFYEAMPRGAPHAVPVVLVHGLGGRAEDWAAFLPALAAQGYHVVAPDLLGYGRSAQPADAPFSIAQETDVVAKFMTARGIQKADIVGWSMGGWIVLKLTLDHPEMVERVAVFDAAGIYFHPGMPLHIFAPRSKAELDELFHYLEPGERRLPYFVERDALPRLQKNAWVVDRSIDAMSSGQDLLDFQLGRLTQPALIVWGANDRLIPPAVGRTMHALIPQSEYVELAGCGHLAPVECSAEALPPLERFLAK